MLVSLFALTGGAAMALPSGLEILKHPAAESRRLEAEQGRDRVSVAVHGALRFWKPAGLLTIRRRRRDSVEPAERAASCTLPHRRRARQPADPRLPAHRPRQRRSSPTTAATAGVSRYGDTVVKLGLTAASLDLRRRRKRRRPPAAGRPRPASPGRTARPQPGDREGG
ncbi:MAG: hypothetical protein H7A20_04905 [Rhodanobacteraceae bacterium]|nr:hypothetical protein [Rhodanobacteraceae bacterium]